MVLAACLVWPFAAAASEPLFTAQRSGDELRITVRVRWVDRAVLVDALRLYVCSRPSPDRPERVRVVNAGGDQGWQLSGRDACPVVTVKPAVLAAD